MTAVGCIGYYTYSQDGLGFRLKRFDKISKAAGEWAYPGRLQAYTFNGKIFFRQSSGVPDITLFIGDSNIEQYYVRTDELIKTNPQSTNSIIFDTGGGCAPIPDFTYNDKQKLCVGLMNQALQMATQDPLIRNVVIGGQWSKYFTHAKIGSERYHAYMLRLSTYIKAMRAQGKRVFFVLSIPIGDELNPKFMAQRSFDHFPNLFTLRIGGIKRTDLDNKYGKIQLDLSQMALQSGAEIIRPTDYLCDDVYCPSIDKNGEPIYKDATHLRPSYVRPNARFMDVTVAAHSD